MGFSIALFKPEESENAGFMLRVSVEGKRSFENDDVMVIV